MKHAPLVPEVHLFVCANRRAAGAPLGPGCGDAGAAVYAALKDEVARRGAFAGVWVTETRCLGVCPKQGATVAIYPKQALFMEVEAVDAHEVLAKALADSAR